MNQTEKQREAAEKQAAKDEEKRFADWKKLWNDEGYSVEGDSFANARVVEIPEGPTYDDTPGA